MEEVAGAPLGRPSCHGSGAVGVGGMTGGAGARQQRGEEQEQEKEKEGGKGLEKEPD